jgi:tetratricopeptide (TPR) repeat protein
MNEEVSEQVFTSPDKDIPTTAQLSSCADSTAVQSDVTPPRRRILQNHRVIWLDANIDETNEFYQSAITKLQSVVNNVETFIDPDQCVDYLTDIIHEKVFMIMSKAISEQLVSLIYELPQLDTIYLFSDHESKEEEKLFQDWSKVKDGYTEITPICDAIEKDVKRRDQNTIPISFVATDEGTSDTNLDELDSSFMYTQILKEIILGTAYNQEAIKDLVLYWRHQYMDNRRQLEIISKFERDYRSELSIWWYTSQPFIYEILNRALRTLEADIMLKMGPLIQNLHRQLEELHAQQFSNNDVISLTVYRGQGLSKKDFEKLLQTKGGLISFNNFLSTSQDRDLSLLFAESSVDDLELIGVLFKIIIDPSIRSSPYARIRDFSSFKEEEEILFSMHSVFRIAGIEKIDNNGRLFQVELELTADDDQQLRTLTNRIREETYPTQKEWYRISMFLIRVGQYQQAEDVCMAVQEELSDEIDKAFFYTICGMIKNKQGDYEKAIFFYEKVVEISERNLDPNDPNLANSYNNIASAYDNKGEHSKALSFFEKALKITQKTLPTNHSLLGASYNNVASIYIEKGDYSKAVSYYEQALKIYEEHLPSNHPDLATSYSNTGFSYERIGEYSKALSFLEKALQINQKILPKNHPNLVISYNNIASVYNQMGECLKAVSYLEKALEIQEQVLSATHPHLAAFYSTIAGTYEKLGEYLKALAFHEQALKIKQAVLSPTHPALAYSYGSIGSIYNTLAEYSKALSFHEKALEIMQMVLPPTHPDLAILYDHIGSVYADIKDYPKALSFHEKALQILKEALPPNHPVLATSFNNIGMAYDDMGEYSKALSFHKKALKIGQTILRPNHPDLATSFDNIGLVYGKMKQYSKAQFYCEKALKIRQQTLPVNHPDLAYSLNNVGTVYENMEEYSKALLYFEKAEEILKKTFKSNHPLWGTIYTNIGDTYAGMEEYSKALCSYEKALDIQQQTLPENVPSLLQLYSNIAALNLILQLYMGGGGGINNV